MQVDARPAGSPEAAAAASTINAGDLLTKIRDLAADSMEGRGPATAGEEKTVAYLTRQFSALGLDPGNPNGTFTQSVTLVGYTSHPSATLTAGGKTIALRYPDDYVANSRHARPAVHVANSELVFVGYGVVAPEYGWDDYKGVDVRGKTIVMLVNDPPVPDPAAAPGQTGLLDTTMFKGNTMTYYGRWTYKYEIATEKGAAAAIIVHETGPAGYPYEVVKGSWSREQFDVKKAGPYSRVEVESWITTEKAKELFAAAGHDFDSLKTRAASKDFAPVPLNGTADFHIGLEVREVESKNVVAKLEGTDGKDEYVIYTAHWDHLGIDTTASGDQIYNGALDNASGTATLLEIAKAFTRLPQPPRRSVLFLALTAEEKGLLGAKYYAENPLYPLEKTAANINMDGINQWGRTTDLTVIGFGNSNLEDVLESVLHADGRTMRPDPEPEKGYFYRSDHFEFAKMGVPALYIDSGVEYIGQPTEYGIQRRQEYTTYDYHKPSDQVKPTWDLAGAVDDARVLFRVGYAVAQSAAWPQWKPGTEFKARRDSAMAAAPRR